MSPETLQRIEDADYDYFYSNRRRACWKRRGKYGGERDISELINVEKRDWQNAQNKELEKDRFRESQVSS